MVSEGNGYGFLGPDVEAVAEILGGRFYFVTFRRKEFIKPDREPHFFTTDQQFIYANYFDDFGPLNLAQLYRYWLIVREKLSCPSLLGKRIVHWTTTDFKKRANAAFLVGCFALLHLGMTPEHVHRLLLSGKHPFVPFQDASQGISKYRIKLIDCLNAVGRAVHLGFFRLQDFDLTHYEHYEKVQNGDLSWLVPEKLLAFSGPGRGGTQAPSGRTPESYLPYFKLYGVRHVVRLNRPNYSDSKFTNNGVTIHDLFFIDGSVPSKDIVYKFLALSEEVKGPLAVHCKAGLGRTGCLVGAYLVKHYDMPALEAIAWMRICRPGCVIGHQQAWLERAQRYLNRSGQLYRLRVFGDVDAITQHVRGVYSLRRPGCVEAAALRNKLEKKIKMKTFQTVVKLGDRRKKKKSSKERSETGSKGWDNEGPQQGDSLHRRKWENTVARDLTMSNIATKPTVMPALSYLTRNKKLTKK